MADNCCLTTGCNGRRFAPPLNRDVGPTRAHESDAIHMVPVPVARGSRHLQSPHRCREAAPLGAGCRLWTPDSLVVRVAFLSGCRLVLLLPSSRFRVARAFHHLLRHSRAPAYPRTPTASPCVIGFHRVCQRARIQTGGVEDVCISVVQMMNRWPNKVTGANAGGPRQLRIRTRWAARVAQFCR